MYITEMDLLKAKLEAEGALNESQLLHDLILADKKSEEKRKMDEGERYFRCEHDILGKNFQYAKVAESKEDGSEELKGFYNPSRSNHHCVNPFHHTLVIQKAAYLVGREPTIVAQSEDDTFTKMLQAFADEEFNAVLTQWVVGAANKGIEYLHTYYDQDGALRYAIVPAEEIIPVYDEGHERELREVIRYYDISVRENGREEVRHKVEWWTDENVTYFTEKGDGMFLKEETKAHWMVTEVVDEEEVTSQPHGWGRVPFIPLANNGKQMSDLSLIKGLVDAYDLISSEGTNNLLDLVDLYWVIQGYGGETATSIARKLQVNKAVHINDNSGHVEAKQVTLPVEGRLQWLKMLRKDIFHFGMGVDTDTENLGRAPSGVALKFQYAMFYLKINSIMAEIKRAMKALIRFQVEAENRRNGSNWDWRQVQITLNTSGITDDMETMEMITTSKGLVSEKTLLGKHPFVEDVNDEMERVLKERKEAERIDSRREDGGDLHE